MFSVSRRIKVVFRFFRCAVIFSVFFYDEVVFGPGCARLQEHYDCITDMIWLSSFVVMLHSERHLHMTSLHPTCCLKTRLFRKNTETNHNKMEPSSVLASSAHVLTIFLGKTNRIDHVLLPCCFEGQSERD